MADMFHRTITLTATGTKLSALASLQAQEDVPLQSLTIQADGANANPVFLGGSGVTITDYGIRIPTPSGGVPAAPVFYESGNRPVKLSEVFVVGTPGEKVHVGGFIY